MDASGFNVFCVDMQYKLWWCVAEKVSATEINLEEAKDWAKKIIRNFGIRSWLRL